MKGILKTATLLTLLPFFGSAVNTAMAQSSAASHPAQSSSDLDATVAHAMEFSSQNLLRKLRNVDVTFHWIGEGDRFWYKKSVGPSNVEYVVVDSPTGKQAPLFDGAAMAAALGKAGAQDTAVSTIRGLQVSGDLHSAVVRMRKNGATCQWPGSGSCVVDETRYQCDLPVSACKALPDREPNLIMSPDRHSAAFVRDYNLWIKNIDSGAERQLTHDGIDGFAYGVLLDQYSTEEVARRRGNIPKPLRGIAWSPDGKYIVTLRHDLRKVPFRLAVTEYLPPDGGTPIVHMTRQALPIDPQYPDATLETIDVASGTIHRSDIDRQMLAYQSLNQETLWWTNNDSKVWFVEVDRGNRKEALVSVDMKDAHSHVSIVEESEHSLKRSANSANGGSGNLDIYVLSSGSEALWYSERDGWGHMYLYDTASGKVKRQITKGPWLVIDLLRVDEKARTIFFTAVGKEPGQNPYYRHVYRASLDGGQPVLLTPENADHDIANRARADAAVSGGGISPNGRYIIDPYSTISQPDKAVLRTIDGKLIANVVDGDPSELVAMGWHPPEPFVVKAADGTTDLYGVFYKPKNFDPSKKYPIIEVTYPADNTKYAPTTFHDEFIGSATRDAYAFAETGAIVVSVDGRQTGMRSLKFRTAFDTNWEDQRGAADHVAAIKNLAATHPFMDINRVGITGHSTGGYASLHSILLFPDFYKVAVSGEVVSNYLTTNGAPAAEFRYGIPNTPEVLEHYTLASNERIADHLKGKLLIIVAGADEEAHFQQSMGVFAALQKANKVYDTLVVPDAPHLGGRLPYGVSRTVRYFAENLGGPMEKSAVGQH